MADPHVQVVVVDVRMRRHLAVRRHVHLLIVLEEIPVAREFPNVFPAEQPGMPPDWEIKFFIELVPDTTLISKATYQMAFPELKKMKTQLEDLFDNGFI